MRNYIYIFLLTLIISLFMTPIVKLFSERAGILDHPNHIKRHSRPIAKAGGIAILTAFLAGLFYLIINDGINVKEIEAIVAGVVVLSFLGLWDDIKCINYIEKFFIQTVAATVLIFSGLKIGYLPAYLSLPLTLFWIVGVTNAVNLQDGMDGLAAGTSCIASFAFLLIGLMRGNMVLSMLSLALIGSCLGFLRYNFPPASIFMGDSGSMFLGFMLSILGVLSVQKSDCITNLFIPVLILAIPVLDTIGSIVRRFMAGKGIFDGDKGHFYDILADKIKLKQEFVLLIIYIFSLILGAASLCLV